jgi:hypothetical protein
MPHVHSLSMFETLVVQHYLIRNKKIQPFPKTNSREICV